MSPWAGLTRPSNFAGKALLSPQLRALYDEILGKELAGLGYSHVEKGLYARAFGDALWHGLWVSFGFHHGVVVVQPNLFIFCPIASALLADGLSSAYGQEAGASMSKLGNPFLGHPLYDRVYRFSAEDRSPFSYNIRSFEEVEAAAELVVRDFSLVADAFFANTKSMQELKARVLQEGAGASTGVGAMALAYFDAGLEIFEEVDAILAAHPSPMAAEFARFIKDRLKDEATSP